LTRAASVAADFAGGPGADGVDQDAGQQVVVAGRDADGDVHAGRLIGFGRAPHPARPERRIVAGAQQARADQLVEVKGGQLAGDPGAGGRFLPADRPVRGTH
jgi:hypothetical protein